MRICTGKNTTLKFSERKEHSLTHSKRKKKNNGTNGHSHHELHKITSPVDIYRYANTPLPITFKHLTIEWWHSLINNQNTAVSER